MTNRVLIQIDNILLIIFRLVTKAIIAVHKYLFRHDEPMPIIIDLLRQLNDWKSFMLDCLTHIVLFIK